MTLELHDIEACVFDAYGTLFAGCAVWPGTMRISGRSRAMHWTSRWRRCTSKKLRCAPGS
jgi:hypothetical protein